MAVSIHAFPILFCVGNEMVKKDTKNLEFFIHMTIMSLATPIGIGIGMIVTEYFTADNGSCQSATQLFVVGILQGLAAGTLLYISFFEVLDREKLEKMGMNGITGCILLMLGFALMAIVQYYGKQF